MELGLGCGSVAVHHALMLLGLLRVTDPGGVDVAHQEARVVTLGFEHVNFAVTRPAAQLFISTGSPEGRPRRTRGRKLDARLGVETSARCGIQHSAIFCLGRDHARRERGIVHSAAILASTSDLRTIPLGLRRGVPGRQVQIAILNRDVLRAIGVIHLRTLRRIEAAILIAPLRGIELVAVELVVPRHLIATGHRRGQRRSARSVLSVCRCCCGSRHGHHCNRCAHRYSQSCHHGQLAQARSLRSGGLTRDLHRDRTSLSFSLLTLIIGVYMPKLSRQSAHVGPWQYTVLCTPTEAEIAYMLTTATRQQLPRKPPDTGSCVRGFFIQRSQRCIAYRIRPGTTQRRRWIIRGHESASIRVCATRLFLTGKAPYTGASLAHHWPVFSPLSNHH